VPALAVAKGRGGTSICTTTNKNKFCWRRNRKGKTSGRIRRRDEKFSRQKRRWVLMLSLMEGEEYPPTNTTADKQNGMLEELEER
jgi:hypothetical protein